MDTALMTFMIQTTPSTKSVHLTGSWDNFTKRYPMERDIRRARGQWRGCYAFEDIICDGEGQHNPKRTGGLKMGSTYYYYYELDDGTEYFDKSIPFTTTCPYLPGQPVNLLWVPIEIQPRRHRRASLSELVSESIKTMNPADKYMAPRPPPPPPDELPRLNTSTSVLAKKGSAQSLSQQSETSAWSPRAFFGLHSPSNSVQDADIHKRGHKRGRSSSVGIPHTSNSVAPRLHSEGRKKSDSRSHIRDASPPIKHHSGDRSPLRKAKTKHGGHSGLVIPDEITEEGEDDDNFASQLQRLSMTIYTPLSPPPSSAASTHRTDSGSADHREKPLPLLPEQNQGLTFRAMVSSGLKLKKTRSITELIPRSHFSTSTVSTMSPTVSFFEFSEGEEDVDADVDLTADLGEVTGDEGESPALGLGVGGKKKEGFGGYSLPDEEDGSQHTLGKRRADVEEEDCVSPGMEENASRLERLLNEMGYLGDVIVQK